MARLPLFYLTDTLLEIGKGGTVLQKAATGAAITDGGGTTVTATIWNAEVNPMTQITSSPLSLTHQGSPDGYWSANIDDDFESSGLTEGLHVEVRISVNAGAGFNMYMELDGVVEVYRGEE
jgi:hypothetical protein